MDFNTIAAECSLFPCARTYTASVVNGSVVEAEVKSSLGEGKWMSDLGDPPAPDGVVINPNENCTWKLGWTGDQGPCTYSAGGRFIMAAGNFFWHFWNGTVSGRTFNEAVSSNDALDILYNGGFTNFTQIDRVLGAISDSMTAAIRLTGQVSDWDSGSGGGQDGLTSKGQLLTAIEMEKEAKRLRVRLMEKSDGTLCLVHWQSVDDDPSK